MILEGLAAGVRHDIRRTFALCFLDGRWRRGFGNVTLGESSFAGKQMGGLSLCLATMLPG